METLKYAFKRPAFDCFTGSDTAEHLVYPYTTKLQKHWLCLAVAAFSPDQLKYFTRHIIIKSQSITLKCTCKLIKLLQSYYHFNTHTHTLTRTEIIDTPSRFHLPNNNPNDDADTRRECWSSVCNKYITYIESSCLCESH